MTQSPIVSGRLAALARPLLTLLALILGSALCCAVCHSAARAQDTPPPDPPPAEQAQPVQPPAEPPQPPTPPAPSLENMFSSSLYEELREQWGPVRRGGPQFYDPANLTVLSVPIGCAIYMAAVADIRGATDASGAERSVEDVIFTSDHLIGNAPLTVALPSGEYVLATRAASRQQGFDGGCVRKVSVDVITGGKRHAYHLYPIRKRDGQYQCFIANFLEPDSKPVDVGDALLARGTFSMAPEELQAKLADSSGVPPGQIEQVALSLDRLGVAYYERDGARYLLKLTIQGTEFKLDEWPVEE